MSKRLLGWLAAGAAAIAAAFVLTRLGAAPDAVVLRPLRDQALVIPCSPGDVARAVHEVAGVGRFCIEREGVDVIKSVLRRGEPWEPYLAPVFRAHARPGTVAIDVGAHIGIHTVALARLVGEQGSVWAFEPQVKVYQEMLANLDLNGAKNVRTVFAAVGDAYGRLEMSSPTPVNEGGTAIGTGGNLCELWPLDAFGLTNVSLLKVDVEGAELGVLRGAEKTLRRERPAIVIEVLGAGPDAPPDAAGHRKAVWAFLEGLGYVLSPIEGSPHDFLALPGEQ